MANEPEGVAVTNQFGDDDDGHHRHLSQTKSEKRGKEGVRYYLASIDLKLGEKIRKGEEMDS